MRKGVLIFFILFFLISFISAGFFSSFHSKITGRVVTTSGAEVHELWDIDDNGEINANYDGYLITAYLMEISDLSQYIGENANRNNQEIITYLSCLEEKGILDIDLSGEENALGDGILATRVMANFPIENLTDGAIDPENALRTSPEQIIEYMKNPSGWTEGLCEEYVIPLLDNVCLDQDGGKDYYTKSKVYGIFSGENFGILDKCENNNLLNETYCVGSVVHYESYFCSAGCYNGKCNLEQNKTVGQKCQQLLNLISSLEGITCDYYSYNVVADVDKDGGIYPDDKGIVNANKYNETWCESKLNDNRNPCVEILVCNDGTKYSECSITKPQYCLSGTLIDDCSVCGCSDGKECNSVDGSCIFLENLRCSDGTKYSECSNTKPYYCSNGNLVNYCGLCGCNMGFECLINNSCGKKVQLGKNQKNMDLYSDKTAFLMSDRNWKDVLPWVSATTWTGNEIGCQKGYGTPDDVCVYPTLIYHQDTSFPGFDADSIIYFFQQYRPDKVIIVGDAPLELESLLVAEPELGAGLDQKQIKNLKSSDYIYFWDSYDKVVYVEDNYELALLASTYASLINAPLVIRRSKMDIDSTFQGKMVICVGDLTRSCDEKYNLEELQKKYVEMTNTDKTILLNPNDLNLNVLEAFQPEKSKIKVYQLYQGVSLAAPFLAGGKKELITFSNRFDYKLVDEDFTKQFLGAYGYGLSDFDAIECKYGDSCSTTPDSLEIPMKESVGDTVNYIFDGSRIVELINNPSNKNFGIEFFNLYTDRDCLEDLKKRSEVITININGWEYQYGDFRYFRDNMIRDIVTDFLYISPENLSLDSFSNNLNISITVPRCKIYRKKELSTSFPPQRILDFTYSNSDNRRFLEQFFFSGESFVTDKNYLHKGLKSGSYAFFNFNDLNPAMNYKVVVDSYPARCTLYSDSSPCVGPFFEGREIGTIRGDELPNGNINIEVNSSEDLSRWSYDLLPLYSVKLYPQIDRDLYLTIFASPDAIQMSSDAMPAWGFDFRNQLDSYYQALDRTYEPQMWTTQDYSSLYWLYSGRIFGITLSDVSSYVARDLFFDDIPKDKSASFIWMSADYGITLDEIPIHFDYFNNWGGEENIYKEFPEDIYKCYTYSDPFVGCITNREEVFQSYYGSYFTFYVDHGWYNYAFIDSDSLKNKYLQPKTNYVDACATCDFVMSKEFHDTSNLFCAQNLRRGGLAYVGAQSVVQQPSYVVIRSNFIPLLLIKKETIGKAWQNGNDIYEGHNPYSLLFGDPTLKPIYWGNQKNEK